MGTFLVNLIGEPILGSSDKSVEQEARDLNDENVSYVDLGTMESIECEVTQQIDCNDSKYSRKPKSRGKEQQKRMRRSEKKRGRQDSGKMKKYSARLCSYKCVVWIFLSSVCIVCVEAFLLNL